MENIFNEDKLESVKSLLSTRNKLENAMSQMTQKGANTTLVQKRFKAVSVGLAVLEDRWYENPHLYTGTDLAEARKVLTGLFPSIENNYAKSRVGSPQRTLLARRLKAMKVAVQAIDDELSNKELKDNL
ncbi:hypothetical protein M3202_11750 [Alkalihalobacillus oceani]|uniref:Uncharacterized protein n=1 Tax=Halalkalibacter oceani TaxID=1653776 RepID=A0A9X2DQV4_9BACI|nr:hypothetical protein [Halalkalibacter oceani]MCM3714752.1 hypothetical protein [Halalkalibacter oceani]